MLTSSLTSNFLHWLQSPKVKKSGVNCPKFVVKLLALFRVNIVPNQKFLKIQPIFKVISNVTGWKKSNFDDKYLAQLGKFPKAKFLANY